MGEITAADGRRLRFEVHGEPTGPTVVHTHGTPGSRLGVRPSDTALRRTGARVITYDRPGCGGSEPLPGRRVADAAADVAAIVDALGVSSFAVYGISGGGPHALACAALLPERVTRVAAMVGLAPYDAVGLDWYAGMTQSNVEEMTAAMAGVDTLMAALQPALDAIRLSPESLLDQLETELPEPDRLLLADPAIRTALGASFAAGLAAGPHGWVDDDVAFVGAWGFDVADIRVPTLLWHGTEDVLAPFAHTEWLSRQIPAARFVRAEGAGHLGAYVAQDAVLDWLLGDDTAALT